MPARAGGPEVLLGGYVPAIARRIARFSDVPRIAERLARIELPDRVEAIGLDSEETRPLQSQNLSLFPEDGPSDEERWSIVDHLRASG